MSVRRLTRVNEVLRRKIGDVLFRVLQNADVDMSAVTVTHVIASSDLRTARVLVSIREHRGERGTILAALRRHRPEIQEAIARNVALKYTPRLTFALDESIEQGDHVLELLSEMEREAPAQPPEGGTPARDETE